MDVKSCLMVLICIFLVMAIFSDGRLYIFFGQLCIQILSPFLIGVSFYYWIMFKYLEETMNIE